MNNAPGDKLVNLQEKKQVQKKNLDSINGVNLQAELTPAVECTSITTQQYCSATTSIRCNRVHM
jgi:hypothetical protein